MKERAEYGYLESKAVAILDAEDSFDSIEATQEINLSLDSMDLSIIINTPPLDPDLSVGTMETVEVILDFLQSEKERIYGTIQHQNIDFDEPFVTVADIDPSDAIDRFRFRKEHLLEMSHEFWPRMRHSLVGD